MITCCFEVTLRVYSSKPIWRSFYNSVKVIRCNNIIFYPPKEDITLLGFYYPIGY